MSQVTILVIDDDEDIRTLLETYLSQLGYRVWLASGTKEAKKYLLSQMHPDIILLDIMMPGLNGLEFASRLKSAFESPVPIIVMTGMGDEETSADAAAVGVADFIAKPFKTEDLKRKIESALAQGNNKK